MPGLRSAKPSLWTEHMMINDERQEGRGDRSLVYNLVACCNRVLANNGSCFNIRPSEYTLPVKLKKTYSVRQSHSSEARSCSSRKGIRPVMWTPNAHFRANNNPIQSAYSDPVCVTTLHSQERWRQAVCEGSCCHHLQDSSTQFYTVLHSHLYVNLARGSFPVIFLAKTVTKIFLSHLHATCPTHRILRYCECLRLLKLEIFLKYCLKVPASQKTHFCMK